MACNSDKSNDVGQDLRNRISVRTNHEEELSEMCITGDVRRPDNSDGSVDKNYKLIKSFVCLIVFIIILGSSVLSKLSFMFMVSQIGENRKVPYCNVQAPEQQLHATIPDKQRVAWIWAIVFAYAVPELITFIKAWLSSTHKADKRSGFIEYTVVFCIETLHAIGMGLLVFVVLPYLNVIESVMLTNCLSIGPAILIVYAEWGLEKPIRFLNTLAVCAQITGFIVWPILSDSAQVWSTPAAITLISFHWWENFVSTKSQCGPLVSLNKLKESIGLSRSSTDLFVSPWKIFVFLNCAINFSGIPLTHFFEEFINGWGYHRIDIIESASKITETVSSSPSAIYWTLLIQIASSFICYAFTQFACKIRIQAVGFSLPINLTVPVSILILLAMCGSRTLNVCAYHNVLPDYLFYNSPSAYNFRDFIFNEFGWIWIFWLLSQAWVTRHIWSPSRTKNQSLFITPLYNGLIIDQSLVLNRRRSHSDLLQEPTLQQDCAVPLVYVCATMWHEEPPEIITFFKSILRLDKVHGDRRQQTDDQYDMETHIFFDSAFSNDQNINEYVRSFIISLPTAMRQVYETDMNIEPPHKYETPYGGRLEWTLPGKTKMCMHLKDSNKIRQKKRWSQVIYMRYLLGHKININRVKNTFILALDGDIDFHPEAVQLLLNRMEEDENLGAASGRIYPIGTGPVVWVQKFEYAIGHWLQKATEHVIGCVLCTPGCFSMFRRSALVDDVLEHYSKNPKEASQFLKYDQGEDRWLSTLVLKAGFRIEYSAAAKAYTHCPKNFLALFKQRLRWISSTIINTFDFIRHSRDIIGENRSITMPYIVYQVILLVGTFLGPGTIFLMMLGGLAAVFHVDITNLFLWNLVPILLFIVVCFKFKEYQFRAAIFLSGVYSLVMMTVLIAMIIQFIRDGLVSPSSVFFMVVLGQILIAGLLHPHEIGCLPYGIMYYMTIPTMYMLLIIYAVINMNDLSWGTRDNTQNVKEHNSEGIFNYNRPQFMFVCCSTVIMNVSEMNQRLPSLDESKEENTEHPDNFNWMNDFVLINAPTKVLDEDELSYWTQQVVKNNLAPSEPPTDQKVLLAELRDTWAFLFIMVNTMFVLVVYVFQLNKEHFYINWPFGVRQTLTFCDANLDITIVREYFQVEPIGFLFITFMGFIMIIQFTAMLVHRFGTLCEVLAATELSWNCRVQDTGWKKFVELLKKINGPNNNNNNNGVSKWNSNEDKLRVV